MAILRVKSGPQKGTNFKLTGDSQILGRESGGQIQILDQGISRKHAEVFQIGEMFFIRDLESRNGTFVNEAKISEEILRVGDQIGIGNTVLVFEDTATASRDASALFAPDVGAQAPSPTSTITLQMTQTVASGGSASGGVGAPTTEKETVEERNLEVLLHLSHIVAEEKNLPRLFERVSLLLGKSLSADHLHVLGIAEGETAEGDASSIDVEKTFELLGSFHVDGDGPPTAGVSRGIIVDCLQFNRSVLTSDASLDQQFNAMESVVMNQLRSVICVPISALGRSIGVIYVYSNRADAFKSEDLELASAVGIQLGSTIELLKLLGRSDKFFRNSMKTLVAAIELPNPSEQGKSARVATYCLAVAKELGLKTEDVRNAWLAGMLHDLGSIPMTPDERANKLTSLTKRNHYARELLARGQGSLGHILPALEQQQERWDGSGSPEGISGESIHSLSRILGLCLAFDNMLYAETGPDGEELSMKDTLLKVKEMADKQFDRQTVNALLIAYRTGRLFNQEEEFFELPTS